MGFELQTLGSFSNVTISGHDVGLIKGDALLRRDAETIDCRAGLPRQLVGRVIAEESLVAEFPMAEISAKNFALSALNVDVSTLTLSAGLSVVDQTRTMQTYQGADAPAGTDEFVSMDRPGSNYVSIVVKDSGGVTTYTVTTDYVVQGDRIFRVTTGAISSGEELLISYDYDRPASERINFGLNNPVNFSELLIQHISPVSGDIYTIFLPRAQAAGSIELGFQEESYQLIGGSFEATPDATNYPLAPLGFFDIQRV